jgi:protein-L-isoaspartate(D-aspartate) O-methyltransferase
MKINEIIMLVLTAIGMYMAVSTAGCCKEQSAATEMESARNLMISRLVEYGISDPAILAIMRKVNRHRVLPDGYFSSAAYGDHPLSIGHEQTISQPFMVAYMTARIKPVATDRILEIGTGSGYQAAVLAETGAEVYSIEIIPQLAAHAAAILHDEGYQVKVRCGDGYAGWPEYAPFSIIIVTCAPEELPQELIKQLADNGRMIVPVGKDTEQRLIIIRKTAGKIVIEEDLPVRFVPMIKRQQ